MAHIRYSYFSKFSDNTPAMREATWAEFILRIIEDRIEVPANDKSKKHGTPSISPAIYPEGVTRHKDHVTGWGGWMGLDVDNDGVFYTSMQDAAAIVDGFGIDYLIYGTTKAKPDHHRFRVLFPISRDLDAGEIRTAWDAVIAHFAALGPDPSCKDSSRIYAAPMIWLPAQDGNETPFNEYEFRLEGDVLDIDAVMTAHPPQPIVLATTASPVIPQTVSPMGQVRAALVAQTSSAGRKAFKPLPSGSSIFASPMVTAEMINDYANAPKGKHHIGLYTFMCAVAGRAKAKGYTITEDDLIDYARQVDAVSPIKTASSRWGSAIRAEARRALQFTA
jgi:hypothetical protein